MATVAGPLCSLSAHGSLAKTLTFRRNGKSHVARKYATPTGEPSAAQLAHRRLVANIMKSWPYLSPTAQSTWANLAAAENTQPINAFFHHNLPPRPILLPLAFSPATFDPQARDVFNDEFDNLNSWAVTGAASCDDGIAHLNPGTYAEINTNLPTCDRLIFFRCRNSNAPGYYSYIRTGSPGNDVTLWFDLIAQTSTPQTGTVSIRSSGSYATLLTNFQTSEFHDWAIWIDTHHKQASVYLRTKPAISP